MKRIIFISLLIFLTSACTGDTYTELQLAAARGQADRVEVMLNQGNHLVDEANKYGKTPLMLASEAGHTDTVNTLVKRGAQIDLQDIDGMTALIFAAANGHAKTIEALLAAGADPNISNNYDATALTNAAFFGHTEATRSLLNGKVRLNDATSANALLITSGLGRDEIVKMLLDYGIDVNSRGKNQRTPLITATAFDHMSTVKLLLANDADITARDSEGRTALEIAEDEGFDDIAAELRKAAKDS